MSRIAPLGFALALVAAAAAAPNSVVAGTPTGEAAELPAFEPCRERKDQRDI